MTAALAEQRSTYDVKLQGKSMSDTLTSRVTSFRLKSSRSQVSELQLEIADTPESSYITGNILEEGTTLSWGYWSFEVSGWHAKPGAGSPTLTVVARSKFVRKLEQQTGEHSWGEQEVSGWAPSIIKETGATAIVQPQLGERKIERAKPSDPDPNNDRRPDPSTWDTLKEMSKQTGAWLFEYGPNIVLGKPSWIKLQSWRKTYRLRWDSHTNHSAELLSFPQYVSNPVAVKTEREKLTVRVMSTDARTLHVGDRLDMSGAGLGPISGEWMISAIDVPYRHDKPVTIEALRPIDPAPILPKEKENPWDEDGGGSSGGGAGVPAGPIGRYGWNGEQLKYASLIVEAAQEEGMMKRGGQLAVACAMGESSLRNVKFGDAAGPDSRGLFQQRAVGWGTLEQRMNPKEATKSFLRKLKTIDGWESMRPTQAIHLTQVNADPTHYTKFWADAVLVVDAVLAAGKSSGGSGEKLTGPLGTKIETFLAKYDGKTVDYDGAWGAQCADLAMHYCTDLFGMPMIIGNGQDYYRLPQLMPHFAPIGPNDKGRKGDIVSWTGRSKAITNGGGYGHVAILISDDGDRGLLCLSQNPGASQKVRFSREGLLGFMRPKG